MNYANNRKLFFADEKKKLLRKIETLENRLALAYQSIYGGGKSCSEKYSGNKSDGINDGRDDFDGTEESLPEGTPGPVSKSSSSGTDKTKNEKSEGDDVDSQDAEQDKGTVQTCYHGASRKGCSYVKEMIGIKEARNDEYRDGIINSMHVKLLDLIAKGEQEFPDKVWRALNYFYNFWDRVFAYRNDGEYSIDNMAVERAIRPLTVQRKNSLFFCSPKGAKNSGIFNTFISTCQQKCRNFRDFFVDFVMEWNRGQRDYENLVRLAFSPIS